MKTRTETITRVYYASSLHPEIETVEEGFAPAIEWGDANPTAWRIVLESKSLAWGKGSSHYHGASQGSNYPVAVLDRLAEFKNVLTRKNVGERAPDSFFSWLAQFT